MKKKKTAKEVKVAAYTPTEVGLMLESIHKEVQIIAEGHTGLDKRLERVEVAVHGNSRRLEMLETMMRISNDKVSHLDDAVSKLGKDVSKLDDRVCKLDDRVCKLDDRVSKIDDRVCKIDKDLKETREELKSEINELGNRLTAHVETHR